MGKQNNVRYSSEEQREALQELDLILISWCAWGAQREAGKWPSSCCPRVPLLCTWTGPRAWEVSEMKALVWCCGLDLHDEI